MNLQINSQLQNGKYRIEKVLGQGGFGITYLAMQVGLNRKVAIKEFFMKEYCNRDEATSSVSLGTVGSREVVMRFREKFIKEAQNIAVLNHPHIIRIYDVFEENNTAYYVMEYLDNASLSEYLKQKGRLLETEALRFIRQIADALSYIHEHKINHLDVKPGNILLDAKNNAVLIDFGLAKRYDDAGNQTSTTPVGISHGYAPLEQYKKGGVGTFSPTTDIYSLAATLFKLVTGQTPPDAGDVNEDGLPDFPSDISQSTINAITQAMQGSRKNRPQSIAEFLKLLDGEGVKTRDDDEATEIVGVERPKPAEPKKEEPKQELPNEQKHRKKKSKAWIFILLAIIIGGAGYYFVNEKMKGEKKKEAEMLAQAEQERIKKEQEAAQIAQAQKEAEAKQKAEAERKRKEEEAKRKAEQERLEKERQELEAEKAELEAQKAEQARLEAERAEQARIEAERKRKEEEAKRKAEQARLEREAAEKAKYNGHEYVDLGLSVKWATCNVGANKPEDYGNYYAWGETSTKSTYYNNNSKTYGKRMNDIKGNSQYDAARANWGGTWRMPTKAELEELKNECTWTWTTQNGVKGYKVTGPNGNSIFLPAAGCRSGSSLHHAGEYGIYWSSTPHESDSAYWFFFVSGHQPELVDSLYRSNGQSVRPVSE